MSHLERRLQILLDQERYERVAREAQRSGQSVAAVIRGAIDLFLPGDDAALRMQAAGELLALTAAGGAGHGEGPAELKAAYAAELAARVGQVESA